MKKIKFFSIILIAIYCVSCNKIETPLNPEFSVTADKVKINAGDTVHFNIQGYSDYLTFYSGERGSDYNYRGGRKKTTEYWLEFRTERRVGTQENQFSLSISTDFNGQFDLQSVNNAIWTDITDRFTLAPKDDFSDFVAINVTDLVVDGKPFYMGWKYVAKTPAEHGSLSVWRFRDFSMKSISEGETTSLSTQTTPAWKFVSNVATINTTLYNSSGTRVTFNQTPSQVLSLDEEIYWCINSKVFNFTKLVDFGPDIPVAIKSYNTNDLNTYAYPYRQPGTYEAVFVGTNGNIKGKEETIRKITIQVE